MAIEGNDWIYLGGAALGGVALGALGSKMFSGQQPEYPNQPYSPILHRRYKVSVPDSETLEAVVGVDFNPSENVGRGPGYAVHFIGDDSDGIDADGLIVTLRTPQEAMAAADSYMSMVEYANPISDWELMPEIEKLLSREHVEEELGSHGKKKRNRR